MNLTVDPEHFYKEKWNKTVKSQCAKKQRLIQTISLYIFFQFIFILKSFLVLSFYIRKTYVFYSCVIFISTVD